jgi:hypothetical protein
MSFVLASLLAVAAPPESQSQIVWKWNSDGVGCVLRQDLGHGRFLDVGGVPGSQTGIRIVDTAARIRSPKSLSSVEVTFSPGGTTKADGMLGPNEKPIGRSIVIWFGPEDLTRLSGASALTLAHAEFGTLQARFQSPAAAVQALRGCEDRKMTEWGIDPVAWRALTVKPAPKTPPVKWFSWLDYPDRKKIYKNDIDVIARLDVAGDGSVLECTVVNRPPVEFIPAACNALKRNARFHPARDARGQSIPAPFIFTVRFAALHL